MHLIKTTVSKWNQKDCTFKTIVSNLFENKSPNPSLMTRHSCCVWSSESHFLYGLCILNSTNVSYNVTNKKTSTRNALSFYVLYSALQGSDTDKWSCVITLDSFVTFHSVKIAWSQHVTRKEINKLSLFSPSIFPYFYN